MTFLKTSLIAGGLLATTAIPTLAADADADTETVPQITLESQTEPMGLLWKEGRMPFVLERFLKDGHLQA